MLVTNDFFVLTVAVGSEIISKSGRIVLNEIPKEAQKLWESGYYGLALRKGGEVLFETYTKEQIEKLIEIRKPLSYTVELNALKSLLKSKNAKPAKASADKVE